MYARLAHAQTMSTFILMCMETVSWSTTPTSPTFVIGTRSLARNHSSSAMSAITMSQCAKLWCQQFRLATARSNWRSLGNIWLNSLLDLLAVFFFLGGIVVGVQHLHLWWQLLWGIGCYIEINYLETTSLDMYFERLRETLSVLGKIK